LINYTHYTELGLREFPQYMDQYVATLN
jgi:hypothetical protein